MAKELYVTKQGFKLGYIRDPPHADARLLMHPTQIAALPSKFIIPDGTKVNNQDGLGCCTAEAFDGVNKLRTYTVAPGIEFDGDVLTQYYLEREHDGSLTGNGDDDVGSTISSAFYVGETYGMAPLSANPTGFTPANFDVPPSAAILAAAKKDVTTQATRLDATDENTTIANMKAAIYNLYPAQAGFTCYGGIEEVGEDGRLPMPSGNPIGGHSTAFIGWDDNFKNDDGSVGAFLSKNSWDYSFGCQKDMTPSNGSNGGYFCMSNTYITNTNDAFGDVIANINQSDFPVTPNPTPPVTADGSTPATCIANGTTYAFVRGTDNALWYNTGTYNIWTSLGGILTSGVAACAVGNDVYAFVRGSDKALWYRTLTKKWASLGGILTASPAAANNNGVITIEVRGSDKAIWYVTLNTANGGVSSWTSLGGQTN
jgi:hypothetical protein